MTAYRSGDAADGPCRWSGREKETDSFRHNDSGYFLRYLISFPDHQILPMTRTSRLRRPCP